MAAKLPTAKRVPGREYSTFRKAPPKTGYKPGDVLDLGKNQVAKFSRGLGWYAAAKAKPVVKGKAGQGQVTGTAARGGGTLQNQTTIETPDQIEARVSKMATEVYNRQKGDLEDAAAQMRLEAEGRRKGMIDAYAAAAAQNATMGGQVQDAWTAAANNLAGIAGTTSGSIADALQADLASKEGALSRVGAAGTGFDARSQAAVEAYRAGVVPGEEFTRLGAVGNEYILRHAQNLREQGLQTGKASEDAEVAKINADRLEAIRKLGDSRTEYEGTLRKEFAESQAAAADTLVDQQKLKIAADKQVFDAKMAVAKLNQQYAIAKMNATTKRELAAVDQIYKQQKLALQAQTDAALINQRNASAALSGVKTAAGGFAPKAPTTPKPPSPTAISNNMVRATKAGNDAIQTVFANLWAKTPGARAPADWNEDKSGPYENSALYAAAQKRTNAMRSRAFGTIMARVVKSITPHLTSLGYKPARIRQEAFNIVSARVAPGPAYKKKHPQFF